MSCRAEVLNPIFLKYEMLIKMLEEISETNILSGLKTTSLLKKYLWLRIYILFGVFEKCNEIKCICSP